MLLLFDESNKYLFNFLKGKLKLLDRYVDESEKWAKSENSKELQICSKLFSFLRDLQIKGAQLNYEEPCAEFYEEENARDKLQTDKIK